MINYLAKISGLIKEIQDVNDASWVNVFPPFEHKELDKLAKDLDIP